MVLVLSIVMKFSKNAIFLATAMKSYLYVATKYRLYK